jgi:FkbM family methyltransferase
MIRIVESRIAGVSVTVAEGHDDFWHLVRDDRWEPETLRLFTQHIDKETTVVDIGAWIGPTALLAAHLGRRVFAFEPDPVAFSELEANVQLNERIGTIVPINAAVTPHGQPVKLLTTGAAGDSLGSLVHGTDELGIRCRSVRLQDFLNTQEVPGRLFIKIDIEGYEFDLVPCLLPLISKSAATVLVSLHPQFIVRERRTLREKAMNRLQFAVRVLRLFWPLRRFLVQDEMGRDVQPLKVIWAAFARGSLELGDSMILLRPRVAT